MNRPPLEKSDFFGHADVYSFDMSSFPRWFVMAMLAVPFIVYRAQADPVLALASSPTVNGSNFTWTYNAYASSPVQSGDFFTIYDIPGYVPASVSAPSGFSSLVQLSGVTPSGVLVPDTASIANVTYQYNGPTIGVAPGSVANLGTFSFVSTDGLGTEGSFTAENSSTQVVGYVAVPSASAGTLAPTGGVLSTQVASAPVADGPDFMQSLQLDNFTDFGFNTGSYVTIYDIAGYYAGSLVSPTNWYCTAQLNGQTPSNVIVTDSASIVNVTCTYTGAPVLTGGPASLGDVTFLTTGGSSLAGLSYSSGVISNAAIDPANDAVGTVGALASVPEPAAFLPAALFALLIGAAARRRYILRCGADNADQYYCADRVVLRSGVGRADGSQLDAADPAEFPRPATFTRHGL
jgi:hypothetical protein